MKNLFSIFLLVLPVLGLGQSMGEIQGKVVDVNNDPVPFIHVYVKTGASTVGVSTDDDGEYKLKPLKPGIYNVTVSGISYRTTIREGVEVNPDKITFLPDITLEENVTMTDEAIVEEFIRPQIPQDAGIIQLLAAEFENSPAAKDPVKLIASMSSDISEDQDGQLYFRGSRTGAVQYIVDGIKLQSQLNTMPSSAIGSISVYTGGVPAKYGDVTGGVVVIETKSYMDYYYREKARRSK